MKIQVKGNYAGLCFILGTFFFMVNWTPCSSGKLVAISQKRALQCWRGPQDSMNIFWLLLILCVDLSLWSSSIISGQTSGALRISIIRTFTQLYAEVIYWNHLHYKWANSFPFSLKMQFYGIIYYVGRQSWNWYFIYQGMHSLVVVAQLFIGREKEPPSQPSDLQTTDLQTDLGQVRAQKGAKKPGLSRGN